MPIPPAGAAPAPLPRGGGGARAAADPSPTSDYTAGAILLTRRTGRPWPGESPTPEARPPRRGPRRALCLEIARTRDAVEKSLRAPEAPPGPLVCPRGDGSRRRR